MTLIVSDNSPLNLLVRLGCPEILEKLFSTVIIPPEVVAEMHHPEAPIAVRSFIQSRPPWLLIRAPKSPRAFPQLDAGEVAAINLAIELHATLLIDETDGRQVAAAEGIPIVGAIGVLEIAANRGLISDLQQVYAQIKPLRFHVSDAILNASLARHQIFKSKSNPT